MTVPALDPFGMGFSEMDWVLKLLKPETRGKSPALSELIKE
jgi:hypothetical protein